MVGSVVHGDNTSCRQFVEDTVEPLLEAGVIHFLMIIVDLLATEYVQEAVDVAVLVADEGDDKALALPRWLLEVRRKTTHEGVV